MADKKKSEINLFPYFVDGEQPTANKFNSIGIQISRNLYVIEKALGDIWNESEPYSSLGPDTKLALGNTKVFEYDLKDSMADIDKTYSLNIPSLARIIGPSSKLNPILTIDGLYEGGTTYRSNSEVTETILSGSKSYCLNFKPSASGSIVVDNNGSQLTSSTLSNLSFSEGEYYYNSERMELIFGDVLTGDCTVTYTTTPSEYAGGPSYLGSSHNVIPDEAQLRNGTELTVTESNGFYEVTLPKVSHSNTSLTNDSGISLSEEDPMYEAQLKLPVVLREMFGGDLYDPTNEGTLDSLIPEGFIYLKNLTTNEVYTSGEYYYVSDTAIKVGNIELDNPSGDKFCLITVGTDITSSIQDLKYKSFTHNHDRTYGEAPIYFKSLVGATEETTLTGGYYDSSIAGNYLPQYIHRDGSDNVSDGLNDNNAMRGDFLIGRKKDSSGNSISTPGEYTGEGDSFRIYFSEVDASTGSYIWNSRSIQSDNLNELTFYGEKIRSTALNHNHLYSGADIKIDAPNGHIRVYGGDGNLGSGIGGYYNHSAINQHIHGIKLGSDTDEVNLATENIFNATASWKHRHMKCFTADIKQVFFSARTRDGMKSAAGDEVYCWARIPLPESLWTLPVATHGYGSKVWSIQVMASPYDDSGDSGFSNFPGVGTATGMNGPKLSDSDSFPAPDLGNFRVSSWAGSAAGGEANASVGPLDQGGFFADVLNWFITVVGSLPILGNFVPSSDAFDKVNGNGLWWKLGQNAGTGAINPHLDIFIGEGWMKNSNMRVESSMYGGNGMSIDLRICIWYSQEDGLGNY